MSHPAQSNYQPADAPRHNHFSPQDPGRLVCYLPRPLQGMNNTFNSVQDFILRNYEARDENDSYLGEIGRLIHAQVTARQELVLHQRSHDL